MRTLIAGAATALQQPTVPLAVLVEMDLDSGFLYLNTSSLDLTTGGHTYTGTSGMGKIDTLADSPAEAKALSFELSGVPSSLVSLALTEPVQGRKVKISLGIFDPSTYALLQVHERWAGKLDVMTIVDGPGPTATLKVTAEHIGIDLLRPTNSLYSDAEQKRLHPGEPSLQYIADQVDMRVIWPAATWRP